MKKILIPCLIACVLTISTNSFGMLARTSRITHTKKVLAQRRKFHKSHGKKHKALLEQQIALLEKQYKISQENNVLLRKIFKHNKLTYEINSIREKNACTFHKRCYDAVTEVKMQNLVSTLDHLEKE